MNGHTRTPNPGCDILRTFFGLKKADGGSFRVKTLCTIFFTQGVYGHCCKYSYRRYLDSMEAMMRSLLENPKA